MKLGIARKHLAGCLLALCPWGLQANASTLVYIAGEDQDGEWIVAAHDIYVEKSGKLHPVNIPKIYSFGSDAVIGVSGRLSFCDQAEDPITIYEAIEWFSKGLDARPEVIAAIDSADCPTLQHASYRDAYAPAENARHLVHAITACAAPCAHQADAPAGATRHTTLGLVSLSPAQSSRRYCHFRMIPDGRAQRRARDTLERAASGERQRNLIGNRERCQELTETPIRMSQGNVDYVYWGSPPQAMAAEGPFPPNFELDASIDRHRAQSLALYEVQHQLEMMTYETTGEELRKLRAARSPDVRLWELHAGSNPPGLRSVDFEPPRVIIANRYGETLKPGDKILVLAEDNKAIARVGLMINGSETQTRAHPLGSRTWTFALPAGIQPGSARVAAWAEDQAGNRQLSRSIQVNVVPPVPPER